MTKQTKRNIILVGTIIVILIASLVLMKNCKGNTEGPGTFKSNFQIENTDKAPITKIVMADKLNNRVTLERSGDTWTVDGVYPASQPMIDMLLETLSKMRIRNEVNHAAVPNVMKDLATHGVQVEVYQNNRLAVTYYVGRETQDHLACYMLRKGDKEPCEVHIPGFRGYLTPRFVAEAIKWRSHQIVDLDVFDIARIELEIPQAPKESFAIIQQDNDFYMQLLDGDQRVPGFDTARVAQMLSTFKNLNFDEFASIVPNSSAKENVSGTPRSILRITDTKGNHNEVKVYLKYTNPEDVLAIPDPKVREELDVNRLYAIIDNKDTVLIQNWIFDHILQPASYFLGKDVF